MICGVSGQNNEQKELIRLILDNDSRIIFVTGDAGTGKNFCSIAAALEQVVGNKRKYEKIYYGRNPVQCGQEIGFTSGDLEDKLGIYMKPLYDTLRNIELKGKQINANSVKQKIEMLEITTIRGRSIDNGIIIVDECQNMDMKTLQTLITRAGEYTKIILMGSFNQIDLRQQLKYDKCDFQLLSEKMSEHFPQIVKTIELKQSMRSSWCAEVDRFITQLRKEHNR